MTVWQKGMGKRMKAGGIMCCDILFLNFLVCYFPIVSCWPLTPECHGSGGCLNLLLSPDASRAGPRRIGWLLASPKTG